MYNIRYTIEQIPPRSNSSSTRTRTFTYASPDTRQTRSLERDASVITLRAMAKLPFAVMSLVLIGCGPSDPNGSITVPDASTGGQGGIGGSSASGGAISSGGAASSPGGSTTSTGGASMADARADAWDGSDGAVLQQPRCDFVPPCATQVDPCTVTASGNYVCNGGVTYEIFKCAPYYGQYFSDGAYFATTHQGTADVGAFYFADASILACDGVTTSCMGFANQYCTSLSVPSP